MNADQTRRALRALADSSSVDFPTPLDWGQWARSLARAVLEDDDQLDALIRQAEEGKERSAAYCTRVRTEI